MKCACWKSAKEGPKSLGMFMNNNSFDQRHDIIVLRLISIMPISFSTIKREQSVAVL